MRENLMKFSWIRPVISCLAAMLYAHAADAQPELESRVASSSITLNGQSAGGVLTLVKAPGGYPYIIVTNQIGESSASVVSRLARQLKECAICAYWYGGENFILEVKENTLVLLDGPPAPRGNLGSTWVLGGTDVGFRIPQPPLALGAHREEGKAVLEWRNPPGGYDLISVVYNGLAIAALPGTATRFVHEPSEGLRRLNPSGRAIYFVIGYKDGTPSNGTGIRLLADGKLELQMNVPFTQGVAPGFEKWVHGAAQGTIEFEQGNLSGMAPKTDVRHFEGRGFYQIIKASGPVSGGVFRRFVGLKPGHTYRVAADMNRVEAKRGSARISVHAAYNPADGADLAPAQLAGLAELPNKGKGPTAGLLSQFDRNILTNGVWTRPPADAGDPGKAVGTVALPTDARFNSITVWLRFEADDNTECAAGIDPVAIEDLGKH